MTGSSKSSRTTSDWNDNCSTLSFTTQLASPKPDVVDKLEIGDILNVELHQLPGSTVVAAIFEGELAGGIASSGLPKLRECLTEGYEYLASVQTIEDGMVSLKIKIAPTS